MKSRVLFILQNAWRKGWPKGEPWPRRSWERALWRSHTGKRLREMIPSGIDFRVINASPLVGSSCDQVFKPDRTHVQQEIETYKPDLVVLLGKVAASLSDTLSCQTFCAPHPTFRLLSKAQTSEIQASIVGHLT